MTMRATVESAGREPGPCRRDAGLPQFAPPWRPCRTIGKVGRHEADDQLGSAYDALVRKHENAFGREVEASIGDKFEAVGAKDATPKVQPPPHLAAPIGGEAPIGGACKRRSQQSKRPNERSAEGTAVVSPPRG